MFCGRFYGSASSRLVLYDFTLPTISCPAIRSFKAKGTGHVSGYEAVGSPVRAPAALSSIGWRGFPFWFGTDNLWTILLSDGTVAQGEKTLWFRQEWSHYHHWIPDKSALKLTITARRLDAPTPPPKISAGPTFNRDWKAFMLGGISFPTRGCWEITGHYEEAEVQFVVWVVE